MFCISGDRYTVGKTEEKRLQDENLLIDLGKCAQCGSANTSVRPAKKGWYYVGCEECGNKRLCDKKYLDYCVDEFRQMSKRRWGE